MSPEQINFILKSLQMTQRDLAQSLGVNLETVDDWLEARSEPEGGALKALRELGWRTVHKNSGQPQPTCNLGLTPEEIKHIRFFLDIPLSDFANRLNVSVETVHGWETGAQKPTPEQERAIDALVR